MSDTFDVALVKLKAGYAMRRLEWRPNKFIVERIVPRSLPYLEIRLLDGRAAPYIPSSCDLYGDDWVSASDIEGVGR